jgi:hypothetical protein
VDCLAHRLKQKRRADLHYCQGMQFMKNVAERDRVKEENAIVIDAADAIYEDKLAFHQLAKPMIQVLVLREPPMAAKVELVTFFRYGAAQAPNIIVTFKDGDTDAL